MQKTNNSGILPAKRQLRILDEIRKKNAVTVGELVQLLGASESTIRRDLGDLSEKGVIDRTHGGAVVPTLNTVFEHSYPENRIKFSDEKERIGKASANLVKDGEIIIIDSGSTTFQVARHLTSRGLQIITNDLSITNEIDYDQSNTVMLTGGTYRKPLNLLQGSWAENFLRNIRVKKAFIGVDAIHISDGIFNATIEEAAIKKTIIEVAREVILVADHSKFGRLALAKICELDRIDTIITDNGLDIAYQNSLRNTNINLMIV